ncbi:hypothetical protein JYU34_018471 [Plutella xylostella]|uniref:Solute carrier family 3 member 2 N-terminal domain-containing protein n=1 Tax=Plutella xylostella TaxID=51655 RepID=A0ABQ7PXT6_PLUXY|nr:uncharacterized protein LOC105393871 [Plutella xylostella]KAG7297752.1 hypothetical protein JYU34_018471 [Plutella xylostella]
MDAERQPLLYPGTGETRNRRYRALSYEEVQSARQEVHWRRSRCLLQFLFWGVMAMCLATIIFILATSTCHDTESRVVTAVPPVHMTFAPLITHGKALNDIYESYAM